MLPVIDRRAFESRIIILSTGCWQWGSCRLTAYANVRRKDEQVSVHRLAYQLFIGEVPDGLDIHHKCGNKGCVNPSHLQCVDRKTHLGDLSPNNLAYRFKRTTHCPKGHPYSEENTHLIKGKYGKLRSCRICRRALFRKWWRNKYGK